MIDRLLKSHLEPVARSSQRWQLWRALACCWMILALAGWCAIQAQRSSGWYSSITFFALIVAAVAAVVVVVRYFRTRPLDYQAIARQIERENPELHALLLTAVEQVPLTEGGQLNYLQQRVVLEALEHHRRSAWGAEMSRRNSFAMGAQWLSLALLAATLVALRPHFSISLPSGMWAGAEHSNGVIVTPGDASLERGSGLVVLAKFEGKLPAQAELVITAANEPEQRVPLTKNLDDPVFGGGIPELKNDLKYHIEFSAGRTRDFKISVFEYPKLDHADATITYPAYTSLPQKTIKNTRRVSAVEGSTLEYAFFLNKPVASAKWVAKDKSTVTLTTDSNNPSVYHTRMTLDQSHRYELVLVDDAGRTNKLPPEFVLEALKNKPPELKLASPRGDQTVSPLEEIAFTGEASDDYGLKSYGIAYTLGGGETKTIELGQNTKPNEKKQFNYVLPLESLGAQPDQLLSYYVWADDTGADGQTRRTTSDIYFAEVKPFDQIFREAQQAEAGGNQNNNDNNNNGGQNGQRGNRPDSLADLEKQIVTATFNLQRRETASKPSDKYKDDVTVVHNSQNDALDQIGTMKEQADDPKQQGLIDAAQKEMTKASSRLGDAADKNSLTPLPSALASEQAAYQAVLKLNAREFQVARGQRGQRGQQSQRSARAQRQLQQLDLAQNQNRYETQRQAQDNGQRQNNPQQREQLQVANRLKELAQRQDDLNQRVRELQAALQEARTEQQRADIRERLKRLTEEQQTVVADVDELRQRLDQQDNQAQPDQQADQQGDPSQADSQAQAQSQGQAQRAAQRQQLDQTRSEVQNAAEQLGQNNPDQALASGTRAQQELQQLQNDVRKQNSAQFTEEMRQMRNDARQLAQNQQNLEQKLTELSDPSQRKLSETDEQRQQRTDLSQQLTQQKAGVTNLLDQMRTVSEKSETAEPLLSQQLYDTVRQTQQDELDSALDSSSELVRRGLVRQAAPYETRARQNIDQLKDNVERAADSVLGDGTDALRIAQRELQQLDEELNQAEAQAGIGRGTNGAPRQLASRGGANNRSGRNGQPGQRGDGQNQTDQNADQPGNGDNPNADQANAQEGQGQPLANGQRQGNQPGRNGRNGRNGQGQPGQRGDGQNQPGQNGDQPGSGGDAQTPDQQNPPDGQGQALANGQRPGNQPGRNGGNGRNGRNGRNGLGQPGGQNQPDPNGDQQANVGDPNGDQQNPPGGPGGQRPGGPRNGRAGNGNFQGQPPDGQNPQFAGGADSNALQRLIDRRNAEANGDTNTTTLNGNFAGGPRNGGAAGGANNYAGGPSGWTGEYTGPLVDTNYVAWTDRLRDVEEMVTDVPELGPQVAQIRDRARALRLAYKRDGKKPDWAVVTTQISAPLAEVRARVDQELLKRTSKDALVPLDRDPVPAQYSERVKRYYEQLGKSD